MLRLWRIPAPKERSNLARVRQPQDPGCTTRKGPSSPAGGDTGEPSPSLPVAPVGARHGECQGTPGADAPGLRPFAAARLGKAARDGRRKRRGCRFPWALRTQSAPGSAPFRLQSLDPFSQLPGPVLQVFGLFLQVRDERGRLSRGGAGWSRSRSRGPNRRWRPRRGGSHSGLAPSFPSACSLPLQDLASGRTRQRRRSPWDRRLLSSSGLPGQAGPSGS